MSKKNDAAAALVSQLEAQDPPLGLTILTEYLFAPRDLNDKPVRRWRFDVAIPERMLAVEIDGGVFAGGRHGGAPSAGRDVEKRQAAAAMGWRVIPMTPHQARGGRGAEIVMYALRPNVANWPF